MSVCGEEVEKSRGRREMNVSTGKTNGARKPVHRPLAELNPNSSTNSLPYTRVHNGAKQPFRCKLTSETALFGLMVCLNANLCSKSAQHSKGIMCRRRQTAAETSNCFQTECVILCWKVIFPHWPKWDWISVMKPANNAHYTLNLGTNLFFNNTAIHTCN